MIAGQGVLAIWNGIAPGHEAEFVRWHVNEHIPERVAVPGFLRARRYHSVDAHPAFFNFYEVETPEVLSSQPYRARLDDPSAWTRRVVPHFTDMTRVACRVVASDGHGIAGFVGALRFACAAAALSPFVSRLRQSPDVSAAHLLERAVDVPAATAESAMRASRDGTARSVLLVEGRSAERLAAAIAEIASDAALADGGAEAPTDRGLYQLDFALAR